MKFHIGCKNDLLASILGDTKPLQEPPKSIVQTSSSTSLLLCLRPDHLNSIFYFFHLFYLLLSPYCVPLCAVLGGSCNRRIWGMVLMGPREEKLRGVANLAHDVLG